MTIKGIQCLSVLEYYEIFGRDGIIAEELNQYIDKLDCISFEKLSKVIDSIE